MSNEEAILHMILRREELKNSVSDLDEDIKAFDMAIRSLEIIQTGLLKDCESCKALEQEPCTDAISRTAALNTLDTMDKALDENRTVEEYKELLRECYEQLPPVSTEKTDWIPVSERFPENAFGCIVTVEEDDIYGEPQRVIYPEFVGYDGETWNDASGKQIAFDVISWMPLPQPYKAEREDSG